MFRKFRAKIIRLADIVLLGLLFSSASQLVAFPSDDISANNITVSGNVTVANQVTANNLTVTNAVQASSMQLANGDIQVKGSHAQQPSVTLTSDGELEASSAKILNGGVGLPTMQVDGNEGSIQAQSMIIKDASNRLNAGITTDGILYCTSLTIADDKGRRKVVFDGSTGVTEVESLEIDQLKLNDAVIGNFITDDASFAIEIKFIKDDGTHGYPFRTVGATPRYPRATLVKMTVVDGDGKTIESFYSVDSLKAIEAEAGNRITKENNQFLVASLMACAASVFLAEGVAKNLASIKKLEIGVLLRRLILQGINTAFTAATAAIPAIGFVTGSPLGDPGKIAMAVKLGVSIASFGAAVANYVIIKNKMDGLYNTIFDSIADKLSNVVGSASEAGSLLAGVTQGQAYTFDSAALKTALVDAYNAVISAGSSINSFKTNVGTIITNRNLDDNYPDTLYDSLVTVTDTYGGILHDDTKTTLQDHANEVQGYANKVDSKLQVFNDEVSDLVATALASDPFTDGPIDGGALELEEVIAKIPALVESAQELEDALNIVTSVLHDTDEANPTDLIVTTSAAATEAEEAYRFILDGIYTTTAAIEAGVLVGAQPGFFTNDFYTALAGELADEDGDAYDALVALQTDAIELYQDHIKPAWADAVAAESDYDELDGPSSSTLSSNLSTLDEATVTGVAQANLPAALQTTMNITLLGSLPRLNNATVGKDDAFGTVTVTFTPQNMNPPFKVFYEVTDRGVLRVKQV